MSTIPSSLRTVARVLLTIVAGAACGTVDNRPPTIGCAPLDGGTTIVDAGHGGGGGNASRVNGCQTGIVAPPPGATGAGGTVGGSGAGGLTTVDGGAFGAGGGFGTGGIFGIGGAPSAGGSLVTGFAGSGVAGSLVGFSGNLNIGVGG